MEDAEQILKKIISFAGEAHKGQRRKYAPEDYIVHPVRVMELCKKYTGHLPTLAGAVLHDVLEDTDVTKEEIRSFLTTVMPAQDVEQTISIIIELTDIYVKDAYPKWNRRKRKAAELDRLASTSPGSQTVKYADIFDNCDGIVSNDPDFAKVFLHECRTLLRKLDKGNPELRGIAVEKVQEKLTELA